MGLYSNQGSGYPIQSFPELEKLNGMTSTAAQIDAAAANATSGTLAAAGSDLDGATLLTYGITTVTGADGSKGVRLNTTPYTEQKVYNSGTANLLLYPNTAAKQIGTLAAGLPVTVLPGDGIIITL